MEGCSIGAGWLRLKDNPRRFPVQPCVFGDIVSPTATARHEGTKVDEGHEGIFAIKKETLT
jgi:hypothetical protein